ncbi:MAG: Ldh family oxidoreductase [Chloroflexi bacterium]|nr:Ldh family oxidoreductase [Chloroflexota bacterium]
MPTIQATPLQALGYAIFQAAGLPQDQARIVTDHLVESNLLGHDSHGIIRLPGYVQGLLKGTLKPAGNNTIVRERPAAVVMDAGGGSGIVTAYQAMGMAVQRAKQHTFGAVAVHHSGHIGRLGAFPPLAAHAGCIGMILLNGGARFTAPFGGVGRRLPPNPLSISVPTRNGLPMTLDITTSMVAGGKVELAHARGQSLPTHWMIDAQGRAVVDPAVFWHDDIAMLPFGGPAGYKGYGLGIMVDAIAGGLSWAGCSTAQPTRGGSGFLALAIDIDSFIDLDDFKGEMQILADWVKSSPTLPGVERIYLPGEVEEETRLRRTVEGIYIEPSTWEKIAEVAQGLGISTPALM